MYCMYICASDTKKRMISLIPLPKNCFSPPWESGKQGPDLEHLSPGHTWQSTVHGGEYHGNIMGKSWEYHENGSVEQGMGQRYLAKFELSDWLQRSGLELTEKYQSVRRDPFTNNKMFIFNETFKYPSRQQTAKVLTHPLCYMLYLSMLWYTLGHGHGFHALISNKGCSTQQ